MTEVVRILTQEDCGKILENYTKRKDCQPTSYTIKPLSNAKEGFIGEHFIVTIVYGDKSESFFLKILDGTFKVIFELSMSINAYDKEEFYYTILLEEFRKCNINADFAPKMYLCKPYLIALENLSAKGYKSISKLQPLNMTHCKISLDTIAGFHTSSIAYETIKTRENGTNYSLLDFYPKCLEEKIFSKNENAATRWLKHSIEGIISIIDLIPENHITAKQFRNKLEKVLSSFSSMDGSESESKVRKCVLHGDLWSNNFLYCYENDIPVHAKLIDYQLLKYGCPSEDVVQFIFSNTRKMFRDDHFKELLLYYHQQFCSFLEKYDIDGSNILPLETFLKSCEDVKIATKITTIADRCVTLMSDDAVSEAFKSEENLSKFLFEERSSSIIRSFREKKEFKDLVTEDMSELRDLLFA